MEIINYRPGSDLKPELSIILSSPNKVHMGNLITQMVKKEKDVIEILYPLEAVENIPQAYNEMLSQVNSGNVVFIRDGWIPITVPWVNMIIEGLVKDNMVGVIGTSWISIHAPLWNIVLQNKIFGTVMVMPQTKNGKPLLYKYEQAPARVVCLDGGLIAMSNPFSRRFDETLKYFYDIDLSMRIHLETGKVRVLPILMQSNELSLSLDSKVNAALIQFRNKWESKCPYVKLEEV